MHIDRRSVKLLILWVSMAACFAGCQPKNPVMPRKWMLGVRVQDSSADLKKFLHYSDKIFGVVIQEVIPNLPAEAHGFQKGDAIERINGVPVTGVKDLVRKINGSYGIVVIDCVRKTPNEEKLFVIRLQLDPAPGRLQEYSVNVKMSWLAARQLREYISDLFRPSFGGMPI